MTTGVVDSREDEIRFAIADWEEEVTNCMVSRDIDNIFGVIEEAPQVPEVKEQVVFLQGYLACLIDSELGEWRQVGR